MGTGDKSPRGVQGQSPGGKPPEADRRYISYAYML